MCAIGCEVKRDVHRMMKLIFITSYLSLFLSFGIQMISELENYRDLVAESYNGRAASIDKQMHIL